MVEPESIEFRDYTQTKKQKWLLYLSIIALVVGIGLTIAGSIMLGIGISKNNKKCPTTDCSSISAIPIYVSAQSSLTYSYSSQHYAEASETIKIQVLNALGFGTSSSFLASFDASTKTQPIVTILGLSKADDQTFTAFVAGLSFTSNNAMTTAEVTDKIQISQDLALYQVEDGKGSSTMKQQVCKVVGDFGNKNTTSTTSLPITVATVTSESPCVCPTQPVISPGCSTENPITVVPSSPTPVSTEGPSTAVPNTPASVSTEGPSTAVPNTPASVSTEGPSTAVPNTPASVSTEAPSTAVPNTPASVATEAPSTAVPNTPASVSTEGPSTAVPNTPASVSTEGPSTAVPNTPASVSTEGPSTATPTMIPTTNEPTTIIPDCFDCYPDYSNILIMIDASSYPANMYKQQIKAINQLVSNWNHIDRIALASYATDMDNAVPYNMLTPNDINALHTLINSQVQTSYTTNLTKSLFEAAALQPTLGTQHTILFTSDKDSSDIASAVPNAKSLSKKGSVTVVGIGMSDVQSLSTLASSNSAIAWSNTDDLDGVVNNIMNTIPHNNQPIVWTTAAPNTPASVSTEGPSTAVPNTPASVSTEGPSTAVPNTPASVATEGPSTAVPNTPASVSTEGPSTAVPNTPASVSTEGPSTATPTMIPTTNEPTTIIPDCFDCYPDYSNILIMIDASSYPANMYKQQIKAINQLVSNWNHIDRIALASYATDMDNAVPYNMLTPNDINALHTLINSQVQTSYTTNLTKSLFEAAALQPTLGTQHTILFTSDKDSSDIASAVPNAKSLSKKGSVTVVGIGMSDVQSLSTLASSNSAIAWSNTDDLDGVVNNIMNTIPHNNQPIVWTTAAPNTPASVSTEGPSTAVPNTPASVSTEGPSTAVPNTPASVATEGPSTAVPNTPASVSTEGPSTAVPNTPASVSTEGPSTAVPNTPASVSTEGPSTATPTMIPTTNEPTTIIPDCFDCYPDYSNILIMIDASSYPANMYKQQIKAINQLVSNWNHIDRIALASYATDMDNAVPYNMLTPNDINALHTLINSQVQTSYTTNLTKSLFEAAALQPTLGTQHTILFTSDKDSSDIASAVPNAKSLSKKGSVTVVGIGMSDVQSLSTLASSNSAIAWSNTDDLDGVVNNIMNTIPHNNQPIVWTTAAPNTPASVSTEGPSTAVPNTPASVSTEGPSTAVPNTPASVATEGPSTAVPNTPASVSTEGPSTAVPNTPASVSTEGPSTAVPNTPASVSTEGPSTAVPNTPASVATEGPSTAVPNTLASSSTEAVTETTIYSKCPDCYPDLANIMVVIDSSSQMSPDIYESQKKAVEKLLSSWNHSERLSFGSHAETFVESVEYWSNNSVSDIVNTMSGVVQSEQKSNLTASLQVLASITPIPDFGQQYIILFVGVMDPTDITYAYNIASILQESSTVIVVGTNINNYQILAPLASDNHLIIWMDTSNSDSVISQIMELLPHHNSPVTPTFTTLPM